MNYPLHLYMSPRQALSRFQRLLQKCGAAKGPTDGNFQRERELRCAALFLMGIGKANVKRYWLRPGEDVYRDVDVQVARYDKSVAGSYVRCEFHLQVTEFESHSDDFVAVIQNKMKKTPLRANLDLPGDTADRGWDKIVHREVLPKAKSIAGGQLNLLKLGLGHDCLLVG